MNQGNLLALFAALLCQAAGCSPARCAQPPRPSEPRLRSEVEAVLAATPPVSAPETCPPLTVLLLSDVKDHGKEAHDYPLWRERWSRLLGGGSPGNAGPVNLYGPDAAPPVSAPGAPGAAGVTVRQADAWPSPAQFEEAGVIVAFCYLKWEPQRLEQMRRYLARGRGLVLIHAAIWTKPQPSAEVGALTGAGGFRFYRHGLATLRIDAPNHPLCLGLPRQFTLHDETYWPITPPPSAPGFTVLASATERVSPDAAETQSQAMFWLCQPEGGRAFGCVPGHFTWTFDDPFFRILLLRGIAWAGGSSPYRFDSLALQGARVEP